MSMMRFQCCPTMDPAAAAALLLPGACCRGICGLKREVLLGVDVVDGDVDPDVSEAGIVAQGGDGPFLHSAADRVELPAVLGGYSEIDYGRAAHDADSFVGVAVPEGCGLGPSDDPGAGASAESDPDTGDLTCRIAGDPGDDPRGDPDCPAVGEVKGVPRVGGQVADLPGHRGAYGGRQGNLLCGKVSHGFPDTAEFPQRSLAVRAAALMSGQVPGLPLGGLLYQLIDVVSAGEARNCAVGQQLGIVGWLASIGHCVLVNLHS
jgi:hypothetical protein